MLARDVIHHKATFQFVVIRLRAGYDPTYATEWFINELLIGFEPILKRYKGLVLNH